MFVTQLFLLTFAINIMLTIGLTNGDNKSITSREVVIDPLSADQTIALISGLGLYLTAIFIWIMMKEIFIVVCETIARHRIFVEKSQRKVEDKEGFKTINKMNIIIRILYYFREYVLKAVINYKVVYHLILLSFLIYNISDSTVVGFPILITYIIYKSQTLRDVLTAVVEPYKEIAMTMALYFSIAWGASVYIFYYLNEDYDQIVEDGCYNLWSCFVTTFDQGYKTGAGPGFAIANPYKAKNGNSIEVDFNRVIFEYIIYFVLVVLVFSILTGIIIDKFSELRERAAYLEQNNKRKCFVCDQNAADLDKKIGYEGFNHHVFYEHNKWDYVFFLCYLRNKKNTPQSGPTEYERIVYEKYIKDDNSWLPCDFDYKVKEDSEIDQVKEALVKIDEKMNSILENNE